MITHFLHCLLFARISEQWVLVVACNNLQAHQRHLLQSPRQRTTRLVHSFVSFLESFSLLERAGEEGNWL